MKYMAPELLMGHTQSDPAIDVWSMGIILYGLVMGDVPFFAQTKEELRKAILKRELKFDPKIRLSSDCKDLLKNMLIKSPEKRISVRDIIDHPWIQNYKNEKRKREWGESDEEDCLPTPTSEGMRPPSIIVTEAPTPLEPL